jgi:hypothetical protein
MGLGHSKNIQIQEAIINTNMANQEAQARMQTATNAQVIGARLIRSANGKLRLRRHPTNVTMVRQNTQPFRCCSEEQYSQWLNGANEEERYTGDNPRWDFCAEADRSVCEDLRAVGQCIRCNKEWWKLLSDDKRRE